MGKYGVVKDYFKGCVNPEWTSEDIANFLAETIRYFIQDDGINPCDDEDLNEFQEAVKNLLFQALTYKE